MLWVLFLAGLFLTLTMPTVLPTLQVHYFPPFLVLCLYRLPLRRALWFATLSGLLFDLLSAGGHHGHVVAAEEREQFVVASAAGDGAFEFERTVSRLNEMQSVDYLTRPHLT